MATKTFYHQSDIKNRESIFEHGLSTKFSLLHEDGDDLSGLTFLTDVMPEPSSSFDIWEVNVDGLRLERDDTTDPPEGENWYCTGSIPRERISLLVQPDVHLNKRKLQCG